MRRVKIPQFQLHRMMDRAKVQPGPPIDFKALPYERSNLDRCVCVLVCLPLREGGGERRIAEALGTSAAVVRAVRLRHAAAISKKAAWEKRHKARADKKALCPRCKNQDTLEVPDLDKLSRLSKPGDPTPMKRLAQCPGCGDRKEV